MGAGGHTSHHLEFRQGSTISFTDADFQHSSHGGGAADLIPGGVFSLALVTLDVSVLINTSVRQRSQSARFDDRDRQSSNCVFCRENKKARTIASKALRIAMQYMVCGWARVLI
jgi:hypothetical protein